MRENLNIQDFTINNRSLILDFIADCHDYLRNLRLFDEEMDSANEFNAAEEEAIRQEYSSLDLNDQKSREDLDNRGQTLRLYPTPLFNLFEQLHLIIAELNN